MQKRKIKWDKKAFLYFKEAIRYIRQNSSQNADKIKQEILKKIEDLSFRPEVHAPDKYKINNSGCYRAFELYRYRIAYLVSATEIIIVRFRHTSQEPQSY
ncbi:type II toxin-antitoxin system RelE/ParE family toxin [Niabella yanshanensis]|uniref:Type II toxin-antitoxin system RelE/ParE family toxin n=1 Tax=Niabella yanshanensis TaxID=577386 RepID=A0ABZ0WBY9_9BACT|nr:type II toxin-antitoxin system RelE/ParE family toxin [Niabella yanshanensis]WQD40109.1 type II toxin-antitoxin system RelE/ParE family toxin [Niabella yanshanensis]